MVQMSFKDISYLELWQTLCSVERNHLCKLVEDISGNNTVHKTSGSGGNAV